MRRRFMGIALLLVLLATTPATAQDAVPNPPPFDHVGGGNVTPPGNRGHISAREAATGRSPNISDQRDLYVDWGLKDWSFAAPGASADADDPKSALGEPYSPRPGVVIYRDGWGVPRIFGATDADAQFGVGYALAEDRLFQADVFRHVARGEMAAFIGGQTWYDYDREWRKEFYRDDELLAMFDRFYTAEERALVQAYVDGINAYIAEARTDPEKLPAEYPALGIVPENWELRHVLSVFVLQARDSVEGFGQELYNAALLADLRERHGDEVARRIFDDVRFYRDPGAYTTAPPSEGRFPYPGGGFEGIDAPGVALPDDRNEAEAVAARETVLAEALRGVGLARGQASNAITVTRDLAADGKPILLGGPQLAYLAPGIFWEFEIHSPSQHARGIGFAGTAGVVLIGKSPTHAWSITYGYTDQVDVFLVPLDPDDPTHYLRGGERRPLETYSTTVTCKADQVGLTSPGTNDLCDSLPAHQTTVTVRRIPEYGPVVGEVRVGGRPHAVVKARGHWQREVANGRPFLTFNRAATLEEFRAAQQDFNVSLNLNYVDDQGNAGFWHVARPPVRARGTDVRLPTLGDGRFDWQDFVPLDDIPHAINPEQGFTANWNNQISAGWHNGDRNSWADVQRVDMLARRMEALAEQGNVTPDDIWRVNREAAYEDGRYADLHPLLLDAYRDAAPADAVVAAALDEVRRWGGERTASRQDGVWRYDAPAVGIFDRFFVQLERDVLREALGAHYGTLAPEFTPNFYHLYTALLVRILRGDAAPLPAGHDWLGDRSPRDALRGAFETAVAALAEELGGQPSSWRTPAVLTRYQPVGLASVEPHPLMNRGTYNELAVVEVAAAAGPGPAPRAVPRQDLPATGAGMTAAALLVLAAAALCYRLRPRALERGGATGARTSSSPRSG